MEVGAQGRIGKKIWFNRLDCFFFFFPPLLNKHQTAIRLVWQYHFLDFDNRWFPAASPPFTKNNNKQIHNYRSKATKPCVL